MHYRKNRFTSVLLVAICAGLGRTTCIFALAATFVFLTGCGGYDTGRLGGEGGSPPSHPYQFATSTSPRYPIEPEYADYKLVRGESRPIWVGGDLYDVRTQQGYQYVWWTNTYNGNPQEVSLRAYQNPLWYLYFQAMTINANNVPNVESEVYTLHVGTVDAQGNYSSQFSRPTTVHFISGRRYNIEYHYHVGTSGVYDVFSLGLNLDDTLSNVLLRAGTQVYCDPTVRTHNAIDVVVISNPAPGQDSWLAYAEANASTEWRNNPNKRLNTALLYAIKNIHEQDDEGHTTHFWDNAVGMSSVDLVPHYSFVIVERIPVGPNRQREINRVTVHELGHQRGLQGGALGHNGTDKNVCVMHDPGDPGYEATLYNPTFCEGHRQKLYNIHWTQEDL
jgi:hypothetical protein